VQTARANRELPDLGVAIGHYPEFVDALVLVKLAAARANRDAGVLSEGEARSDREGRARDPRRALPRPVSRRLVSGRRRNLGQHERQRGDGERRARAHGSPEGDYEAIDPHDDLNGGQSTNDVIPTALKSPSRCATTGS
jgi:aspartate ammonia-lyase